MTLALLPAVALGGAISVESGGNQFIPSVQLTNTSTNRMNLTNGPNGDPVTTTTGSLSLFVDATNGLDTNLCTSSGTSACLTIQGAVNKVPKHIRHPVTISVAAGTYGAGASIEGFVFDTSQTTAGAFLKVTGTLANATVSTGTATGTLSSATSNNTGLYGSGNPSTWVTATDSTQTWTAHNLQGDLLVITGGTGAGQVVAISDNTPTVITLAGIWPVTTPNATSTYAIQVPSSHINGGQTRPTGALGYGQGQSVANLTDSFYIDSNMGGFLTGIPNGGKSTDNAFSEPVIVIERFDFNGATETFGLAGMGQYIGIRANTWTSSFTGFYPIVARETHLWVESNILNLSVAGSQFIQYGTLKLGGASNGATGYVSARGNVTLTGGGATGTTFAQVSGANFDCIQNAITTAGGASTGLFVGGGSHVYSAGNTYTSLSTAVRSTLGLVNVAPNFITIDGDIYNSNTTAVQAGSAGTSGLGNVVEFGGTAASGSGNTTGINAFGGSYVIMNTPTTFTSTNDITLDGTTYTLVTLRALASKGLFNTLTGTRVVQTGGTVTPATSPGSDWAFSVATNQATGTGLIQQITTVNAGTYQSANFATDVTGVGGGNFVLKLCSDGATCAAGNTFCTLTVACTASADTITACTAGAKTTYAAGTTLSLSIATACATTNQVGSFMSLQTNP